MDTVYRLLEETSTEAAQTLHEAIRSFRQWADPPEPWNLRFIKDTELAWLDGRPYIGDA